MTHKILSQEIGFVVAYCSLYECEALRNFKHRNLVRIITACSSVDSLGNDFKALVYEYMEKGSLEKWLHPPTDIEEAREAPKSLNLLQRLSISIDVACFILVDYLHNHFETPIVHCDLKPKYGMGSEALITGYVYSFEILLQEMFTRKRPTANVFNGDLNLHVTIFNQCSRVLSPYEV
ncbi:probable LRR receptor-like serine/threonine-protein kinase At3g47570 [Malus sylvestris]|uniref:probable LRR receptor-like serine/threonine-protein kinase At3g47570 n=1 Tax=Malus sylvestris TaxID=3752 RepID=UPI0021ABC4D9|nr:probable LRR receptor-like serine/threonine-protein kinase At3g47570 [Malus sylvestris]